MLLAVSKKVVFNLINLYFEHSIYIEFLYNLQFIPFVAKHMQDEWNKTLCQF